MIGNELRKARQAAGLTQEEVAFEAGVDRSYLSQLENNRKSPTLDLLFRICGVLRIKASTLVGRVERARDTGG